jgi:DNA-binding IclR family transcriptional regulator
VDFTIYGADGKVSASLAMSGIATEIEPHFDALMPQLIAAAGEISAVLKVGGAGNSWV